MGNYHLWSFGYSSMTRVVPKTTLGKLQFRSLNFSIITKLVLVSYYTNGPLLLLNQTKINPTHQSPPTILISSPLHKLNPPQVWPGQPPPNTTSPSTVHPSLTQTPTPPSTSVVSPPLDPHFSHLVSPPHTSIQYPLIPLKPSQATLTDP